MAADRVMLEDVTAAVAAVFGDNACLIWSGEHNAWWRPNCQGYTVDRRVAGRYTIASAYAATSHCGPEKAIAFVQLSAEDWRRVPAQSEVIEGILSRRYAGPFSLDKAVAAEIASALGPTASATPASVADEATTIAILRRALAWHGDPQRMATTREEWQQVVDEAILWVRTNPEPDRPSFSSFATHQR